MDFYTAVVSAGIPTDNHESDLYVLNTAEARALCWEHGKPGSAFVSQIDGRSWLDIPFAYTPWWNARGMR